MEEHGLAEGLAADQAFLGATNMGPQRWADSDMPVTRVGRYGLCLAGSQESLVAS